MTFTFETKIKFKKIGRTEYKTADISLKVNDIFFDPDLVTAHAKRVMANIKSDYWNFVKNVYLKNCTILVKLSGLHFDICKAKEYFEANHYFRNLIFYFRKRSEENTKIYSEESFVLIVCDDSQQLKKLFERYWFALGYEQRFEGFVIGRKKASSLLKSNKFFDQILKKDRDLIKASLIGFDNCSNGFHFRIIARKKYFKLPNFSSHR